MHLCHVLKPSDHILDVKQNSISGPYNHIPDVSNMICNWVFYHFADLGKMVGDLALEQEDLAFSITFSKFFHWS